MKVKSNYGLANTMCKDSERFRQTLRNNEKQWGSGRDGLEHGQNVLQQHGLEWPPARTVAAINGYLTKIQSSNSIRCRKTWLREKALERRSHRENSASLKSLAKSKIGEKSSQIFGCRKWK